MDPIYKLFLIGVIAAILIAAVRMYQQSYSLGLALCAVSILALASLQLLKPAVDYLDSLRAAAGMHSTVFSPLVKVCGIGLLTELSCAFCSEAGEQAISKTLELGGAAAALCALIPLMESILDFLKPYLEV